MITHRIVETKVSSVPRINSNRLSEKRLPMVLRPKKAAKTQMSAFIILFSFSLSISLYFMNSMVNRNIFNRIEKVSKVFISSTELSFPAQTIS
jgi:hypothetical protein